MSNLVSSPLRWQKPGALLVETYACAPQTCHTEQYEQLNICFSFGGYCTDNRRGKHYEVIQPNLVQRQSGILLADSLDIRHRNKHRWLVKVLVVNGSLIFW